LHIFFKFDFKIYVQTSPLPFIIRKNKKMTFNKLNGEKRLKNYLKIQLFIARMFPFEELLFN